MYTLVRAIALPNQSAAQWSEVSLGNRIVSEIFSTYREIAITVTQDEDTTLLYLDLNQLRQRYAAYQNTLSVLLQFLGNPPLDTMDKLPGQKVNYIKYNDVYRASYKVRHCRRGLADPENYPKSALTDLELTRPNYATDLSLIHSHCLVSVNGFYHMTDTDGEVAFVVDGGKSVMLKNMAHLGITSFLSIGELTKHKLATQDIQPRTPDQPLKKRITFTVPEDLNGRSFFLVLGGFLVLPQDGVFYQAGERSFELNLERLPYVERLIESRDYIDLSPLGLTPSELSESNLNLAEVWSDAVIRKYLTLSQSFFVIVETDKLFFNKIFLRQMLSPGIFTAYQDPTYPLVVGTGRTAEYWKTHEDGQWAVSVADSFYRNYIFDRQQESTLVNVTDHLACDRPFFHSQGFLLEIGAYS